MILAEIIINNYNYLEENMKKSLLQSCVLLVFIGMSVAQAATFNISTNELVINAVDVGNEVFEAHLTTSDIKTFTLTSAKKISGKSGAHATFNPVDSIAALPFVKTSLNGIYGAPSYFQVKLKLIPNTNPLQFSLADASAFSRLANDSHSSSIALTADNRYLVVANRSSKSVSIFEVMDATGQDKQTKLIEVPVGTEPRYVTISPDDKFAYVSNAVSGTVSIISIAGAQSKVVNTITVGSEPRGIAFSPNGHYVYVANHTSKSISQIDTASGKVTQTIQVAGNPMAIAITNDGDSSDTDETVYVTDFYSRTITGKKDGFDDAKQGIVYYFKVTADSANFSTIAPLASSGFAADRSNFCAETAAAGDALQSEIFCLDTAKGADNTKVVQGVYPNQFYSALIRNDKLYLPNVGAAPAPPIKFNVNVQALINVLDTKTQQEMANSAVNLNNLIKTETQPDKTDGSLVRLFGSDIVAIDGDETGENMLVVSRGGNYVIHVQNKGAGLTINVPNVTRYQTGNIPTGVVMASDGRRAYTNNEVGYSISALNLQTKTVLSRDIASATPPAPETPEHRRLVGKLTFYTSLGTANNGIFKTAIRDIIPVDHRNKASDNGWSSCSSCHNDGWSDGVTWFFPTGPRQTIPLDAFFAKGDASNQRISNWNAVRGSVTDFNNNSRNIQGGEGFADDPSVIFNHAKTKDVSDALDAMTEWVQIVRSPIMPAATDADALDRGKKVFVTNCASCHGGAKWTKSQVVYPNNPTFDSNPLAGGKVLDNRITNAGPQIVSFEDKGKILTFLEDVKSFNATEPFEIRGAGGAIGKGSVGGKGFNVPSLLGVGYHGFYLHDGSAHTLDAVWSKHNMGDKTIEAALSATERKDLETYLNTIDDKTVAPDSETETFLK